MAIIFPLKPRLRTRHAFVIIGVIWMLALGVSLPVALQSGVEPMENGSDFERCGEIHWKDVQQKGVYSTTIMILQYFVPLWVLLVTYTHIGFVVWLKKTPGEAESSRDQRLMTSKRKVSHVLTAQPVEIELREMFSEIENLLQEIKYAYKVRRMQQRKRLLCLKQSYFYVENRFVY